MQFDDHYHLDFATQRAAITFQESSTLENVDKVFVHMDSAIMPWREIKRTVYAEDGSVNIWLNDAVYPIQLTKEKLAQFIVYVSIAHLSSGILEKVVKSSHFKEAITTSRKLDNSIESATAAAFQAEIDLKKLDMPFDIDKFLDRVKDLYLSRDVLMKQYKL